MINVLICLEWMGASYSEILLNGFVENKNFIPVKREINLSHFIPYTNWKKEEFYTEGTSKIGFSAVPKPRDDMITNCPILVIWGNL